MILLGVARTIPLIGIAIFGFACALPATAASANVIWVAVTPNDMQGRVFAMRRMVSLSTLSVAMLAAGPLVERVFGPFLEDPSPVAVLLRHIVGDGEQGSVGLVFSVAGVLLATVVAAFYILPLPRHWLGNDPYRGANAKWRQAEAGWCSTEFP